MSDPLDILAEEAQSGAPIAPEGVADALGAPEQPGPAPASHPVSRALKAAWGKLTSPTTKTPEEYRGKVVARIVNKSLDGRVDGPAAEAMVGESTSLVIDHLMSGKGGQSTPLGYLTSSVGHYAYLRIDQPVQAAPEPEAE